MVVRASWLAAASGALLAVWLVWLCLLWRPARQVELHTRNLLGRVSARDWPAVEAMLSPNYRDGWGHDRPAAIDEARRLLSHFFVLQIAPLEPLRITEEGGERLAASRLGVFGTGTAVAESVIEEVRASGGDAVFVWRQSGRWPWAWLLTGFRGRLAGRHPQ